MLIMINDRNLEYLPLSAGPRIYSELFSKVPHEDKFLVKATREQTANDKSVVSNLDKVLSAQVEKAWSVV